MTKQNEKTGEQLLQEDIEKSKALAATMNALKEEQIFISEKVGAIKAFSFAKKLMTVSEIKLLADIKSNKDYRQATVINTSGEAVLVRTWAEFCQALGGGREHIDENIRNLSAFGEAFLEASQRMGVGYRDLRRLRALPEDDREVIINGETIQSEDKEGLLDIIEEMAARHAKEKEAKDKESADLQAELEASQRLAEETRERLAAKDLELIKRESATMDDKVKELFDSTMRAHIGVIAELNRFEEVIKDSLDTGNKNLERFVTYYLMDIRSSISDLMENYALDHSLIDKDVVADTQHLRDIALKAQNEEIPDHINSGVNDWG